MNIINNSSFSEMREAISTKISLYTIGNKILPYTIKKFAIQLIVLLLVYYKLPFISESLLHVIATATTSFIYIGSYN